MKITTIVIGYSVFSIITAINGLVKIPDEINSESKYLYLNYTKICGSMFAGVRIGSPGQYLFKIIDQATDFCWTSDVFFNVLDSSTAVIVQDITKTLFGLTLTGHIISDTYNLGDDEKASASLKQMQFYCFNQTEEIYSRQMDTISLAYSYSNANYSLIYNLKNQKLIDKSVYYIVPNKEYQDNGTIFIGNIPSNYKLHKLKKAEFKVKGGYLTWGFDLKGVIVGEYNNSARYPYFKTNENNSYAYFQVGEGETIVPVEFTDFLRDTLFSDLISKKSCYYRKDNYYKFFECYSSDIKNLPKLTFVFQEYTLNVDVNKFFYFGDVFLKFNIVGSLEPRNTWLFGTSFLLDFIAEFNSDESKIVLYSKERDIINIKSIEELFPLPYYLIRIILFKLIISIGVLGIVIGISNKFSVFSYK